MRIIDLNMPMIPISAPDMEEKKAARLTCVGARGKAGSSWAAQVVPGPKICKGHTPQREVHLLSPREEQRVLACAQLHLWRGNNTHISGAQFGTHDPAFRTISRVSVQNAHNPFPHPRAHRDVQPVCALVVMLVHLRARLEDHLPQVVP